MMKKNKVEIDVAKALTEIKRQIGEWNRSHSAIMAVEKLQVIEAAERYYSLVAMKELLELMQKKEISLEEMKALLDSIVVRPRAQQSRMKFGNSEPKNPV